MKAVMQTLFVAALAGLWLTGCGQKGDLSLPTQPPAVATPSEAATEQPAPATSKQSVATSSDQHSEISKSPERQSTSTQPEAPTHFGSTQPNATQR